MAKKSAKPKDPPKSYEEFVLQLTVNANSRDALRRAIVEAILAEKKGYWEGTTQVVTKYRYDVERLNDGRVIYLLRPTFLNKGIDFQVWVERFDGSTDARPSHPGIIGDLKGKRDERPGDWPRLFSAVERVWNCESPDRVLESCGLKYESGLDLELVFKSLKWLFIEQDVTYWNYDGRMMLLSAIRAEIP